MANEADRFIAYDSKELRKIASVLRKMGDESNEQAKEITSELTKYAVSEIQVAARNYPRPKQSTRIADGIVIKQTSNIGEFSIGFARQKFSGGADGRIREGNTPNKSILAGIEFGAKKQKHFLPRTPKFGLRGSTGYFIFPTLRKIQPYIINKWENAFSAIVKEWDK